MRRLPLGAQLALVADVIMPFALIGGIIAYRIWNELPAATRKYIDEHEKKPATP